MGKKRILFVIPTLGGGGAEKILVDTVRCLDVSKYEITVCALFNTGVYIEALKGVCTYKYIFNVRGSDISRRLQMSLALRFFKYFPLRFLHKLLIHDTYDIEIAFLEGVCARIVSGAPSEIRKLAWIHINPEYIPTLTLSSYKDVRNTYKSFDKICCVSSQAARAMRSMYDLGDKVQMQLNVLDETQVIEKSKLPADFKLSSACFNLLTLGRLHKQKAFPRLLRVAKRLHDDGLDFFLTIMGDGAQRPMLEKYLSDNSLDGVVAIRGFQRNPYPYLKQSDLFVCSSLDEGYSTVVSEATILGIPTVTTDCAGMQDILGDSEYGLIVDNDEDSLYEGIKLMLTDKAVYEKYKLAVKQRSSFFRKEDRIKELEKLFDY